MVGQRPQHAVSQLTCSVLSSATSCRSSICPGRLSTASLVSLVFSCHMVSNWWHATSIGCLWGGWYALPRTISFFSVYIISMTFVISLTQMLVLLSVNVMLSILLSILVCAAASLFCACLVSVQVSAPYDIAGSTQELYTCLFRQMQGCFWRYSGVLHMTPSLPWFFVVSLCPGSFPWGCSVIPSTCSLGHYFISTLFTFIWVLSTTTTFVFQTFILRPIRLLSSDSSCRICCSSCGVSVHRNMSSAKRIFERNSPSIVTPLFSQLIFFFKCARQCCHEQLAWDGVPLSDSPLDPDFLTVFVQMYCHWSVRILCLSGCLCTHLLFLVIAMMSILLGFVLSRMPSRNPRKQHTVVCCIHGTFL